MQTRSTSSAEATPTRSPSLSTTGIEESPVRTIMSIASLTLFVSRRIAAGRDMMSAAHTSEGISEAPRRKKAHTSAGVSFATISSRNAGSCRRRPTAAATRR